MGFIIVKVCQRFLRDKFPSDCYTIALCTWMASEKIWLNFITKKLFTLIDDHTEYI